MAAVNALKKIVEAPDASSQIAGPEQCLLEIFCVDTSISMARSQSFPYIFGESKLSLCRRIIAQGFALPDQCTLYTALVKFNSGPSLAIPFALHNTEQNDLIKASLSQTEHQKGSAIYTSYAFCEKTISEFQQAHGLQGCKVLIHLFTDGIDNGSHEEDVAKYQGSIEPNSVKGLRQSFLYSFDTAFEQSSALAKSLQAHLVTIHESELNTALEERDRWVLKFLASKPKLSKAHKGFNLAKGYTPDMASVYNVLQKTYRFFSSGKNATSKEGLFRVNANVNDSKRLASQLLSNSEHLNDFEDSILVAHALKTALANGPPILPPAAQTLVIEVSHQPKTSQMELMRPIIADLPQLNRECFHMLLFLLNLVAKESSINKMTSTNLAVIFTYLLFPDLLVPNPSLQELMVMLIDECHHFFPQPPLLKPNSHTIASSSAQPTYNASSSSHTLSSNSKIEMHESRTLKTHFDTPEHTGLPSASSSAQSIDHTSSKSHAAQKRQETPPRVKKAKTTTLQPAPHIDLKPSSGLHVSPQESQIHEASNIHDSTHHNEEQVHKSSNNVKRAESAASALHRPLPPHLRASSESHVPLVHVIPDTSHKNSEKDANTPKAEISSGATAEAHHEHQPHHQSPEKSESSSIVRPSPRLSAPPALAPPATPTTHSTTLANHSSGLTPIHPHPAHHPPTMSLPNPPPSSSSYNRATIDPIVSGHPPAQPLPSLPHSSNAQQ